MEVKISLLSPVKLILENVVYVYVQVKFLTVNSRIRLTYPTQVALENCRLLPVVPCPFDFSPKIYRMKTQSRMQIHL